MKHVLWSSLLAAFLLVGCDDGAKVAPLPSAPVVKVTTLPIQAKTAQTRLDAVREALKGEINTGGVQRLKGYSYDPDSNVATVDYVTDVGLTSATTRDVVRAKMSDLYTLLLAPGEGQLREAQIAAWGSVPDRNGQPATMLLVKTDLKASQLVGVNWQADKSVLGLTVIPGKWSILAGGFQ